MRRATVNLYFWLMLRVITCRTNRGLTVSCPLIYTFTQRCSRERKDIMDTVLLIDACHVDDV